MARLVVGVPLVLVLLAGAFLAYRVLWGMPDTATLPGVVREPVERYAALLDPYMPEPLWVARADTVNAAEPTEATPPRRENQSERIRATGDASSGTGGDDASRRPTRQPRRVVEQPHPETEPNARAEPQPEPNRVGKVTDFFGLEVDDEDLK